jgi:hypothetical protein
MRPAGQQAAAADFRLLAGEGGVVGSPDKTTCTLHLGRARHHVPLVVRRKRKSEIRESGGNQGQLFRQALNRLAVPSSRSPATLFLSKRE